MISEIRKAQQAWLQVLNNPAATDAEYVATRATFKALRRAETSQSLASRRALRECAERQAVGSSDASTIAALSRGSLTSIFDKLV